MTGSEKSYHHGDLRAALLHAAEQELGEKGRDQFSLRSVAKRAGVSHAAPAHHFGDVTGLMAALATLGFDRFLETQKARQAQASAEPREQLLQAGFGYINFAMSHPALFRLMFGKSWGEISDVALKASADAAFDHLVQNVAAVTGGDPETDPDTRTAIASIWAMVHGLADLMIGGAPRYLTEAAPDDRDRMLRQIIGSSLPAPEAGPAQGAAADTIHD